VSRLLFVSVFISTWLGGCAGGCGGVPAPDPNVALVDGYHIGICQQEGRMVKAQDGGAAAAWETYDKCMRDYGFRDGGAK
jgi:hypothetical protein